MPVPSPGASVELTRELCEPAGQPEHYSQQKGGQRNRGHPATPCKVPVQSSSDQPSPDQTRPGPAYLSQGPAQPNQHVAPRSTSLAMHHLRAVLDGDTE